MNHEIRTFCLTLFSLVLLSVVGCGSSTEHVKETTSTTTYVPEPPRAVVVQPAPVTVVTPPTSVTTTEEKSDSHSTDAGNDATQESTSTYHSESTTVTPQPAMGAPTEQRQSTYTRKAYKESTD